MDDLTALLAAIITHPEEDTPRLMYADLLDERGEPGDRERAEFVRVQVELYHLQEEGYGNGFEDGHTCCQHPCPLCTSEERCQALEKRNRQLMFAHGVEWTRLGFTDANDVGLLRGFVDTVRCTAENFLRHADALLWHPTQTVECERCWGDGDGPGGKDGNEIYDRNNRCRHCTKGRVPRPLPPTAQPIRRVVLTTEPDFSTFGGREAWKGFRHPDRSGDTFHCDRWPGVEFVLPNVGTEAVSDDEPVGHEEAAPHL